MNQLLIAVLSTLPALDDAPVATVQITAVDTDATGYATFQSHNQKVVWNRNGIFISYIRSRNKEYTAQQWRLARRRDGSRAGEGTPFEIVHQATHATNPPVLETDGDANVYLVRPDFKDGHAYLYRFLASEDYETAHESKIPGGAAGKFAMTFDARRKQLYYFAHNNTFHVVGLDGTVKSSRVLLRAGKHAVLQYPLLSLASDGALHAAWTTQKHGVYMYWDIHHIVSRDAGATWRNIDGSPGGDGFAPPIIADDSGPTSRVSLDDEFESHTWLSFLMAKEGKLHMLYMAQTKPEPREHYVRRDATTGKEEIRVQPVFQGNGGKIALMGLSGFFATRAGEKGSPLYCVSSAGGRLGCLASEDNGEIWRDHALGEKSISMYSIGGARELTPEGDVIGFFTEQLAANDDTEGKCTVHFFRIHGGEG